MINLALFLLSLNIASARVGIVVPNAFEAYNLICPDPSDTSCLSNQVFTLTDNSTVIANRRVYEGTIGCTEVVFVTSGLATINAALTTQLLIDYYPNLDFIITYGIAGGLDDSLNIGDVIIPGEWAISNLWLWQQTGEGPEDELPLEPFGDYTREVGFWDVPQQCSSNRGRRYRRKENNTPDFGNVWFQRQEIFDGTLGIDQRNQQLWMPVDPDLFSIAENVADDIRDSLEQGDLDNIPQVITRRSNDEVARGITGDIFVDNAAIRDVLLNQFDAQLVDMETAAVAMTAQTNNIPFIAFRSLSDLAGGSAESEINDFFQVVVGNAVGALKIFLDAANDC